MQLTVFEGYRGVRGYGDTAAPTPIPAALQPEANAVMDGVISVMRATISTVGNIATAGAYASAATEPGWLNALLTPVVSIGIEFAIGAPQNRRDAYLSALNTYSTIANRLDGPDRADVLAGRLAMKKWLDAALIVQEGIFSVLQDMGSDMQPAAELWNAIQTSYGWAKSHAKDIPTPADIWTWLKWGIPLGLGGALLIGLIVGPRVAMNTPAGRIYRLIRRKRPALNGVRRRSLRG